MAQEHIPIPPTTVEGRQTLCGTALHVLSALQAVRQMLVVDAPTRGTQANPSRQDTVSLQASHSPTVCGRQAPPVQTSGLVQSAVVVQAG